MKADNIFYILLHKIIPVLAVACPVLAVTCGLACNNAVVTPDERIRTKIESFDKVEQEILAIEQKTTVDARKRIYDYFYHRRTELIKIAEGDFNQQDAAHRALAQQMAWFVLCEIKREQPNAIIEIEETPHIIPAPISDE